MGLGLWLGLGLGLEFSEALVDSRFFGGTTMVVFWGNGATGVEVTGTGGGRGLSSDVDPVSKIAESVDILGISLKTEELVY